MLIKVNKNWKDLVTGPAHRGITRRDLLVRGMATGTMAIAANQFLLGGLFKKAMADGLVCPPPTTNPGAIAQIFASGGPTIGARFISEKQAAMMNATIAANYGISGQANLKKLGSNLVIDTTSPFGFTLMQGPEGYPGGAAAWQTNVLSKISGGGHLGPFSADDGAGSDSGLIGGVSPFKPSQMGKDIQIGVSNTMASWANGLPSSSIKGALSPTSLAKVFSMTPAAAGLINAKALDAASQAANALSDALAPVLKNSSRRGASQLATNAGCAFFGNSVMADPNYGTTLFNPANISDLTAKVTVSSITTQEQALLAGFYQSAKGVAGGVAVEFGGRDYHGQSPQNTIAPADIEEARTIVMFLAACEAAQAKGSMIYLANGNASASGVQAVTATIAGQSVTVNAPVAQGDAGPSYNGGLIIFYDPKGAPPVAKFTGAISSTSGNATVDANVASSKEAVAGLYLSAFSWIGNSVIAPAAISKMQASGVAATPSKAMVI